MSTTGLQEEAPPQNPRLQLGRPGTSLGLRREVSAGTHRKQLEGDEAEHYGEWLRCTLITQDLIGV